MATTSKAPKSATTATAAKPKGAPVKAKTRTATAAAKPAKTPIKKAGPAKAAAKVAMPKPAAKPVVKPAANPVTPSLAQPAKTPLLTVKPKISTEQRRNYIEVAAYFIAERSGFSATSALDHWTQAEAEIDRLLREGKLSV